MRIVKNAMLFGLLAVTLVPSVRAWNCPSGQIRQQAPAGTPTNTPYYDVVEGIAFICVPNTPPSTPSPSTPSTASASQSQSSSTSTSAASSQASGKSTSNSGVKNSGNSTATGGNATATGGNATGGNSNVSNSGNSSNRNTASATNSGNNSSSTYAPVTTTTVEAPKIPVATAYAPTPLPTVTCFKGFSGGVQTAPAGISFGGGKIDSNCANLEAARQAPSTLARCKVNIQNKYVKEAGVTLADCLADAFVEPPAVPVVSAPPPAPQPIVVTVAPPPIPAPVITKTVTEIGNAPFVRQNVVNRLLDSAISILQTDGNASLILTGPVGTYKSLEYIKSRGIDIDRVTVKLTDTDTVKVEVYSVQ